MGVAALATCRDEVAMVAQGTLCPGVVVMAACQGVTAQLLQHVLRAAARGNPRGNNHDGMGDDGDNDGGIVVRQMSLTTYPPVQQTIVSFS